MPAAVLLPEQLQRHAWRLQLAMDRRPVRQRPPRPWQRSAGARIEPRLQRLVRQVVRQRPREAGPPRPAQAVARLPSPRCSRLAAILRFDMPAAAEPQHVAYLAHGQSLLQTSPLPVEKGPRRCRFADHPTVAVTPPASTAWSRSPGTGGRDQSERLVAINRNSWSRSPGARRRKEHRYRSGWLWAGRDP